MPWTQREIVDRVSACVDAGSRTTMFPLYAHCINVAQRDREFMELLQDRSNIGYADGMAVVWASRILDEGVPERCTTTDLFPQIIERSAAQGHRVFFLGAAPGVADECARRMSDIHPSLQICGVRDGFFEPHQTDEIVEVINESSADIVFVGMGMPFQEKWVMAHRDKIEAAAVLTCGATFDFHSGLVRRAPAWMRRSGVEWLFRLTLEPRRLWRRYLIGNMVFIAHVARGRLRRRRPRGAPIVDETGSQVRAGPR